MVIFLGHARHFQNCMDKTLCGHQLYFGSLLIFLALSCGTAHFQFLSLLVHNFTCLRMKFKIFNQWHIPRSFLYYLHPTLKLKFEPWLGSRFASLAVLPSSLVAFTESCVFFSWNWWGIVYKWNWGGWGTQSWLPTKKWG